MPRTNALPTPKAVVQEELAELEEVARKHLDPSAEVSVTGGRQVHVVVADTQRPGDPPIEQLGQPEPGGRPQSPPTRFMPAEQ
jgi:hypothetical protein